MANPTTPLKVSRTTSPLVLWWHRLRYAFLHHVWYLQPTTYLFVNLNPALCMQILVTLAKPSVKRLEYRNLFANGRRYFFSRRTGKKEGFYMASTHKLLWSRQRRSQTAAILLGEFVTLEEGVMRIAVQSRMRLLYMLDVIPLPLFTASLVIFMPWHPLVIGALIIALFTLSWIAHRTHAMLEAHTMTYFIEQALEHHLTQPNLLESNNAYFVYDQSADFKQAWERFMSEQTKRPS